MLVRHRLVFDSRIIEGKDIEDAERNGCPKNPRTELSPARLRPISQKSYRRIDDHRRQTTNHQDTSCHSAVKSKNIGVELQLEHHHHLEHKIRSGISKGVAHFFAK